MFNLLMRVKNIRILLLCTLAMCGSAHAAVYSFTVSAAAKNGATVAAQAGQYILMQVEPDPTSPNVVLFTIMNRMPLSHAQIFEIGFDTGRDRALFSSMSIKMQIGADMAASRIRQHPYLRNFNPSFAFGRTGSSLYDPSGLQMGDSIRIAAELSPGRSFKQVESALKLGIDPNPANAQQGLRIGVMVYHLLGERPTRATIMDDAGFIVSRMIKP